MPDTISNYREVTFRIYLGPGRPTAALFARVVRSGRASDRMLRRAIHLPPMPTEDIEGCIALLRAAVEALEMGSGTPPR